MILSHGVHKALPGLNLGLRGFRLGLVIMAKYLMNDAKSEIFMKRVLLTPSTRMPSEGSPMLKEGTSKTWFSTLEPQTLISSLSPINPKSLNLARTLSAFCFYAASILLAGYPCEPSKRNCAGRPSGLPFGSLADKRV